MTGGRPSLFHFTLLRTHSTASLTPVPVSALTGSTLESRMLAPLLPSKDLLHKPFLDPHDLHAILTILLVR